MNLYIVDVIVEDVLKVLLVIMFDGMRVYEFNSKNFILCNKYEVVEVMDINYKFGYGYFYLCN